MREFGDIKGLHFCGKGITVSSAFREHAIAFAK